MEYELFPGSLLCYKNVYTLEKKDEWIEVYAHKSKVIDVV